MSRIVAGARRAPTPTAAVPRYLLMLPVAVLAFSALITPLLDTMGDLQTYANVQSGRLDNKLFWPLVSAMPLFLAAKNPRAIFNSKTPPALIALFVFLAWAGLSVFWAFKPMVSLTRYVQQIMVLSALIVPALLMPRSVDLIQRVYIVYAVGAILNLFFVLGGTQTIANKVAIGYQGYFLHKNILGEFVAYALFLSLGELGAKGARRYFALVVLAVSTYVLVMTKSKTSLALAVILPILVFALTIIGRIVKISPAILFFGIVATIVGTCWVLNISQYDISEKLYHDRTFTNRTEIWDFALFEVAKKPWAGWGFQSFWLVGLDGPSFTDGATWVRDMPTAHNGYIDIQLSVGRVGLWLMIIYIVLTLLAIGKLAAQDMARARGLFSLALFIVLSNFLESSLMDAHGFSWPLFVLASVEAARLTVGDRRRGRAMQQPSPVRAMQQRRQGPPNARPAQRSMMRSGPAGAAGLPSPGGRRVR